MAAERYFRWGSWQVLSRLAVLSGAAVIATAGAGSSALGQCVTNGGNYVITASSGGTIVPGDTDTGNNIDDGVTPVSLPFTWTYYGVTYDTAYVSSNGNVQFTTTGDDPEDYFNTCPLPSTSFDATLCPYWDDQRTDNAVIGGQGIFTSVSGDAPNRIFNIEFRTVYFADDTLTANYEVRLYEGQARFDFVYGAMEAGGSGGTIGCQEAGFEGSRTTMYSCNADSFNGPNEGTVLTFDCQDPAIPDITLALSSSGGFVGSTVAAYATVTPGTPAVPPYIVTLDASAINAGTVTLYDDGTHGDATAGDLVYTNSVTVGAGTADGDYTLVANLTDSATPTPHSNQSMAAYHVGYCTPSTDYDPCDDFYEYISNVTIGSISNNSDCSQPSYEDYSAISTNMNAGDSAPISIMIANPFAGDECTVWVDWDNNGQFTDANEAFPMSPQSLGDGEDMFNGTITVPAGTSAGAKRMRITLSYDEDPSPCPTIDTTDFGNIEDYTIQVGPSGPVCGSADFNCDGDVGTDADIEGFFACLAGSCPSAPCTNSADFNGDGDVGTDADIEAFFRVLGGGNC